MTAKQCQTGCVLKHRRRTYQGKECRAPSSGSGCIPSCGCSSLPWMSDSLASQMWPCPSDWSTTARKKKMYTHFIFFSFWAGTMANITSNSLPTSYLIQITCLCYKAHYWLLNKHRPLELVYYFSWNTLTNNFKQTCLCIFPLFFLLSTAVTHEVQSCTWTRGGLQCVLLRGSDIFGKVYFPCYVT